jgi:hypothetical protein
MMVCGRRMFVEQVGGRVLVGNDLMGGAMALKLSFNVWSTEEGMMRIVLAILTCWHCCVSTRETVRFLKDIDLVVQSFDPGL